MLKIIWLSQYNLSALQPEIILNRQVVQHSSSWIHSLSNQLATNKEIELHIITHTQLVDSPQTIKKNGIHYHIIKYNFPFTKKGFPWYLPWDKITGYHTFITEATAIINVIKPDIIHIHGTEGGYYLPALKTTIPHILSIQGIISEYNKIEPSISGYMQIKYELDAVKQTTYFGCRTNFDKNFIIKNNKKAIIFDLPEAMNKVFFENRWKPSSDLSIVFVGSILERKGIKNLIFAVARLKDYLPSIKLKIIGSGSQKYLEKLKMIINEKNIKDNILWMGARSPVEIATELTRSGLFVLPTNADNSPNCLAEAMAVGIPCIATNVGGIPSMLENNIDGILYDKNNLDELVHAIRLLFEDKNLQLKFSENARKKARDRNYPETVSKKYVAVYKSLAENNLNKYKEVSFL